jgi:hypothetical protein
MSVVVEQSRGELTPDLLDPSPPLEMIALELALQHQDYVAKGFEGTVLGALQLVGGKLLFRMRMNTNCAFDWVAAVELDALEGTRVVLVAQPSEGNALKVVDAATSKLPVANVARAYATLMGHLEVPTNGAGASPIR